MRLKHGLKCDKKNCIASGICMYNYIGVYTLQPIPLP